MACILDELKKEITNRITETKGSKSYKSRDKTALSKVSSLADFFNEVQKLEKQVIKEDSTSLNQVNTGNGTPIFDTLPSYAKGQNTKTYAGVGSRETPIEIMLLMNKAAKWLEEKGYTLRSGQAVGADMAFEGQLRHVSKNGKFSITNTPVNKTSDGKWDFKSGKGKSLTQIHRKEIYVTNDVANTLDNHPAAKKIPNKHVVIDPAITLKTKEIAKEIHPVGESLKGYALDMHARNTHQIFGPDLNTPVDFVLYFTPDGKSSGTDQALRLAKGKGVPTINMADKDWRSQLTQALKDAKSVENKSTVRVASVSNVKNGKVESVSTSEQSTINVLDRSQNLVLESAKGSTLRELLSNINTAIQKLPEGVRKGSYEVVLNLLPDENRNLSDEDLKSIDTNILDNNEFKPYIIDWIRKQKLYDMEKKAGVSQREIALAMSYRSGVQEGNLKKVDLALFKGAINLIENSNEFTEKEKRSFAEGKSTYLRQYAKLHNISVSDIEGEVISEGKNTKVKLFEDPEESNYIPKRSESKKLSKYELFPSRPTTKLVMLNADRFIDKKQNKGREAQRASLYPNVSFEKMPELIRNFLREDMVTDENENNLWLDINSERVRTEAEALEVMFPNQDINALKKELQIKLDSNEIYGC